MDWRVISLGKNAGDNSLREYGLPFDVLNILNEHGLVIADYNSWGDYKLSVVAIKSGARVVALPLTYQGTKWALQPTDESRTFDDLKLNGVAMTSAGKELTRVIEIEPVPAYDEALNRYFESRDVRMTPVSPASSPGPQLVGFARPDPRVRNEWNEVACFWDCCGAGGQVVPCSNDPPCSPQRKGCPLPTVANSQLTG